MRGVLATVDKADITRTLGSLSDADRATVERSIAGIIGLTVPAPS